MILNDYLLKWLPQGLPEDRIEDGIHGDLFCLCLLGLVMDCLVVILRLILVVLDYLFDDCALDCHCLGLSLVF